eukprot:446298-Prymnesium_polylepis.2
MHYKQSPNAQGWSPVMLCNKLAQASEGGGTCLLRRTLPGTSPAGCEVVRRIHSLSVCSPRTSAASRRW